MSTGTVHVYIYATVIIRGCCPFLVFIFGTDTNQWLGNTKKDKWIFFLLSWQYISMKTPSCQNNIPNFISFAIRISLSKSSKNGDFLIGKAWITHLRFGKIVWPLWWSWAPPPPPPPLSFPERPILRICLSSTLLSQFYNTFITCLGNNYCFFELGFHFVSPKGWSFFYFYFLAVPVVSQIYSWSKEIIRWWFLDIMSVRARFRGVLM